MYKEEEVEKKRGRKEIRSIKLLREKEEERGKKRKLKEK